MVSEGLFKDLIVLLSEMVKVPSFSREESKVADILEYWLRKHGFSPHRKGNNIWLDSADEEPIAGRSSGKNALQGALGENSPSNKRLPVILLNAHIDTVHPAPGYTRDPFSPDIVRPETTSKDGCETASARMYGLGTNDDGASVVALLAAYIELKARPQHYRLIWSATAEEEVCGKDGIEALFPIIGNIDLGIMGEPTKMELAVAEKGLMVLDCSAKGRSGHAARNEGLNAIYEALPDIEWFRTYQFPRVSAFLGSVKMTVTQINAGFQHNVIPDSCSFVVDVRSNGMYSNPEMLGLIRANVKCEVKERSTRLESSHISSEHPIVQRAKSLGIKTFGSATTSNQTLSPFPTVKIGPGDSARSHSADEYIELDEIRNGIETYISLLDGFEL